jgi:hypothetical protein
LKNWLPGTYSISATPVNPKYGSSITTQFNLSERRNITPGDLVGTTLSYPATQYNNSSGMSVPPTRFASVSVMIPLFALVGLAAVYRHIRR